MPAMSSEYADAGPLPDGDSSPIIVL